MLVISPEMPNAAMNEATLSSRCSEDHWTAEALFKKKREASDGDWTIPEA